MTKPFIKWVGGKTKLLPTIKNNLPPDFASLTYVEPFLGGGSVFFELNPTHALIGDLNSTLIAAYMYVRDSPHVLIELLKRHEVEHRKDADYYYKVRSDYNIFQYKTKIEAVAQFLYLNKTCFNGLYRVNSKGEFNTPKGSYVNPKILNESLLLACSESLKDIQLYCGSYMLVDNYFNKCEKMFIYADPPYDGTFNSYQKEGFGHKEQTELYEWLLTFSRKGGKFLLSNSDTPFIRELYKEFTFVEITLNRSMDRKKVSEILVRNY